MNKIFNVWSLNCKKEKRKNCNVLTNHWKDNTLTAFTLYTLLNNNIPLSLIAYFGLSVTSLLSFGCVHDTLLLVTASVIHRFYFCFLWTFEYSKTGPRVLDGVMEVIPGWGISETGSYVQGAVRSLIPSVKRMQERIWWAIRLEVEGARYLNSLFSTPRSLKVIWQTTVNHWRGFKLGSNMITSAFWRADSACTAEAGTEREIGARLELQCQKVRERKQALNTLSLSLSPWRKIMLLNCSNCSWSFEKFGRAKQDGEMLCN